MTTVCMIDVARIDDVGKLKTVHPDQAQAMAELFREAGGQLQPIRVQETANGYRLIFGARRLAAAFFLDQAEILASVRPLEEEDEAEERIEAIIEQFGQRGMTVLERAQKLNEWKTIYESRSGVSKHGGKRQNSLNKVQVANLATCFSEAAAQALDISDRSIHRSIQIVTGILPDVQEKLRHHSIADRLGELQLLCAQTPVRQSNIIALVLGEPIQAHSVTDAIAILDEVHQPKKLTALDKLSQRFVALRQTEKERFFELQRDEIERWQAKDAASRKPKLRAVS